MEKIERNLERKIRESLEYFKRAYMKRGYFRMDYGKGLGTDNSPDYHEALDRKGFSKIVGNSSFSPRVRRVPVYLNNEDGLYHGWTIPHHHEWVLSIHPKLADGIPEIISPKNISEIKINPRDMSNDEILDMIREFLNLTNAQVMEKFKIDPKNFSKRSLNILEDVDRHNKMIKDAENALIDFSNFELQTKKARPVRIKEDKIVC